MPECGDARLNETPVSRKVEVGGRQVGGEVDALMCTKCGHVMFSGPALEAFEISAAAALIEHRVLTPQTFRFALKALGIKSKELVTMFFTIPETVSRWEAGTIKIGPLCFFPLLMLLQETMGGELRPARMLAGMQTKPAGRR